MSSAPHTPHCPRCDYDLQGQLATWHPQGPSADNAHCPTQGTCSECGLIFEWCFLLRPELLKLRWFVETPADARLPYTPLRTCFRAFAPWKFWRDVRLEVSVVGIRVRYWLACVIILPILLGNLTSLIASSLWLRNTTSGSWTIGAPLTLLAGTFLELLPKYISKSIELHVEYYAAVFDPSHARAWISMSLATGLGMPLMLILFPITRKNSKVHLWHIMRAWAYSLSPILLVVVVAFSANIVQLLAEIWDLWTLREWAVRLDPLSQANNWYAPANHQWLWIVALAWFATWWACALRIGFRMQDWRITWLAMLIPSTILGLLAMHMNLNYGFFRSW